MLAGGEDSYGDGEIETGSLLADVGRGQINGGPARWKSEAAVNDGRSNPITRFAHRRIGQADKDDLLRAGTRVDFDFNGEGIDTLNGSGSDLCEHETGFNQA